MCVDDNNDSTGALHNGLASGGNDIPDKSDDDDGASFCVHGYETDSPSFDFSCHAVRMLGEPQHVAADCYR